MAVPINKEELQIAIQTNYQKLQKELSSIPLALTDVGNLEGHAKGTNMSVHNLVSYLLGWGELVLKWNQLKDQDQPVAFPESGYRWNELGKLAQKFYRDYSAIAFPDLLRQLDGTVEAILELIAQKSNAELYEQPWYEKWTLGRMIQFNTASPYTNARGRLRKWKKAQELL